MMGANRKCTEQDTVDELILDTDNNIAYIHLKSWTRPYWHTLHPVDWQYANVDLLYRITPAGYDKTKHSILLKTLPHSTF